MAIAVIRDSELQADFKDFGQVNALQNAHFTGNFSSFYPSFIEDLDVVSRKQPRCSKVSSGWPLCILLALTMGILGGVQTGLAMAAASNGAAPGFVVAAPWTTQHQQVAPSTEPLSTTQAPSSLPVAGLQLQLSSSRLAAAASSECAAR